MKALTLHQPWAHAICHLGKRVENRTWAPPASLPVGSLLAIHAGKVHDHAGHRQILAARLSLPTIFPRAAVVAVAKLIGTCDAAGVRTCMSGRRIDIDAGGLSAWFCGPVGWVLDDVRVLREPVPCKGRQGLWDLPPEVEQAVIAQIGGA